MTGADEQEFARLTGVTKTAIRRLLDPAGEMNPDAIQEALAALGSTVVLKRKIPRRDCMISENRIPTHPTRRAGEVYPHESPLRCQGE